MTSLRHDLAAMFRLAGPLIVARLSIMSLMFIDTVVVGQYSPDELAFISVAGVPTSVLIVTVLGLLTGVQVMAAKAVGAGDLAAAGAAWRRGLADGLLLSVSVSLLLAVSARPVLEALGQPEAIVNGATPVTIVLALSIPFQVVYSATSILLESMRRPRAGMVIMLFAIGANWVLDVAFVTGWWGLPAMGAVGAAWATVLVRILMAGLVLAFILRLPEAKELALFQPRPRDPEAHSAQRQLGTASAASQAFEVAAFSGMTVFAGWVGTLAVASYAIALNITGIVFMVALGFATASAVLVSQAIGAGDTQRAIRDGWLGIGVTSACMAALGVIAFVFPGPLARIYASDPTLLAATTPLIVLAAFVFLTDGGQTVLASILRARGECGSRPPATLSPMSPSCCRQAGSGRSTRALVRRACSMPSSWRARSRPVCCFSAGPCLPDAPSKGHRRPRIEGTCT